METRMANLMVSVMLREYAVFFRQFYCKSSFFYVLYKLNAEHSTYIDYFFEIVFDWFLFAGNEPIKKEVQ